MEEKDYYPLGKTDFDGEEMAICVASATTCSQTLLQQGGFAVGLKGYHTSIGSYEALFSKNILECRALLERLTVATHRPPVDPWTFWVFIGRAHGLSNNQILATLFIA
ncbi:hypothetical protein CEXT_793721 [Caerostris extrusa]|uniref:Uncharacterized protein n=1 Tax=Caerostris extrusa TaxID=172846 RepID=A0AAV4NVU4_CAEEX|nr:hypothetical protein CEXT_793721 [Caerostris extrusa]